MNIISSYSEYVVGINATRGRVCPFKEQLLCCTSQHSVQSVCSVNAMLLLSAALLQHHICCVFVAGGEEMMALHLLMRILILIHKLRRKCFSSSLFPPRPLWLNQSVSDASLWYRIYINGDTGWCRCVAACECYMLQRLTSSPKRMSYWPKGRSAVELKVYRNYYTIRTEGSNVYWDMVA